MSKTITEGGTTYYVHTTLCGVKVQTQAYGAGAIFTSVLTECCGAAVTGDSLAPGLVCKGCFQSVPSWYDTCATWDEEVYYAVEAAGCPDPVRCAIETIYNVSIDLEVAVKAFARN